MKKLSLFSLMLMAASMFLFLEGCRKDEVVQELKSSPEQNLFFNNDAYFKKHYPALELHQVQSRNAEFESDLREIQGKLKSLDDKHGIIFSIVSKYGMPLWGRPLISEKQSDKLLYVYSFPFLHRSNDFVNGYIKVLKNKNGHIQFQFVYEPDFFKKYAIDFLNIDYLSEISILNHFNIEILNKTLDIFNISLKHFLETDSSRVQKRHGCWDDVVVHLIVETGTTTLTYNPAGGNTAQEIIDNRKDPKHGNYKTVTAIFADIITVRVWNPDCGDDDSDETWLNEFNSDKSGGVILPKTTWELYSDIMRQKLLECRSWAEDGTGGVDVMNGNPDYNTTADDEKHKTLCERIKILDNCRGLDDDTKLALLTAVEMGLVPPSSLVGLAKKHCGKGGLDAAIDAYINCPGFTSGENIFGNGYANFNTFIDSYMAIEEFLAAHKGDNAAAQLAVEMKQSLCGGSSTGGSGNALKKEDLEAVYVIVNSLGGIQLSSSEFIFLAVNPVIRVKISDLINTRLDLSVESKKEAIKLYSKLLSTNSAFVELDAVWPTIPAFVWPFIKEIGAELGAELFKSLAKKYSPEGQVKSVIDAIKALEQGELLDFIAEVIDIIKTKFPAAAIIDAGIDSYNLYKKAEPVWQAISKMEKFGGDAIGKFLTVIKGTGGNILDKFKWKNNSVGAELLNVGDPQTFWNNFKNLFPDITGPYPNPQQPLEQVYKVLNDSIIIRFYPVSDSTGGPTLALKINGHEFKIRFN